MEVGLNLKIGRPVLKPATKREADLVQIQVQPMVEKIVLNLILKLNFVQAKNVKIMIVMKLDVIVEMTSLFCLWKI